MMTDAKPSCTYFRQFALELFAVTMTGRRLLVFVTFSDIASSCYLTTRMSYYQKGYFKILKMNNV